MLKASERSREEAERSGRMQMKNGQEEYRNKIPPELLEEWAKVTQPFKDSARRWEAVQERKEAKMKGQNLKKLETYEQAIRNNTIDEFIAHLHEHLSEDNWVYVMACEIAEEMKGGG